MFDNNVILRLKDDQIFTDGSAARHGILLGGAGRGLPCGTPVLLDSIRFNDPRLSSVRSFCLFPPRYGANLGKDAESPKKGVELIDLKPMPSVHRVIELQRFDMGRLPRLLDYVHSVGGISFTIENEKGRTELPYLMPKIAKYYRYASVFNVDHNSKFLDGEDDGVIAVLSFFDLPYCVPLFNMKKVHGLGVSYCQAIRKESERQSHLVRTFRFDFVLSNYEDNIFVIDGVDINPQNAVGEKWVSDLKVWAEEKLLVRNYSEYMAEKEGIKWTDLREKGNPIANEINFEEATKWYTGTFYCGSSGTSNNSNS